jgi:hypothetical protein
MNGHGQKTIEFNGIGVGAKNGIGAPLYGFSDGIFLTFHNPFAVDSYLLLVNASHAAEDLYNLHCTGALDADHIDNIEGFRIRTSGDLFEYPIPAGDYRALVWLDASDGSLNNLAVYANIEREYHGHDQALGVDLIPA